MLAMPLDTPTRRHRSTAAPRINRRYTIRRYDAAAQAVDLDVGRARRRPGRALVRRGARRATGSAPYGPRGKVVAVADRRLAPVRLRRVGPAGDRRDDRGAAGRRRPRSRSIEVAGRRRAAGDRRGGRRDDHLGVPRRCRARGARPASLAALGAAELPDGPGHAYLSIEMGVVTALRAALDRPRARARRRSRPKAYWRRGARERRRTASRCATTRLTESRPGCPRRHPTTIGPFYGLRTTRWTASSTSPSGAASSSRRARSTAASAPPGTTARSACSSSAT